MLARLELVLRVSGVADLLNGKLGLSLKRSGILRSGAHLRSIIGVPQHFLHTLDRRVGQLCIVPVNVLGHVRSLHQSVHRCGSIGRRGGL